MPVRATSASPGQTASPRVRLRRGVGAFELLDHVIPQYSASAIVLKVKAFAEPE